MRIKYLRAGALLGFFVVEFRKVRSEWLESHCGGIAKSLPFEAD